MRFGVVVFPGTWSDCDFHYVISEVIRQPVKYVWHRDRNLADLDCVVLPGGFSYGDYLRAGAVAGKSPVVEALRDFVANGGYVLGSCNGFQIRCEAGMLPGVLMRNECLQYRCQSTNLLVENVETPFTRGLRAGQVLTMPISHGEGKYYADAGRAQGAPGDRLPLRHRRGAGGEGGQPERLRREHRGRRERDGHRARAHAAPGARGGDGDGRHRRASALPVAPRHAGRGRDLPQAVIRGLFGRD